MSYDKEYSETVRNTFSLHREKTSRQKSSQVKTRSETLTKWPSVRRSAARTVWPAECPARPFPLNSFSKSHQTAALRQQLRHPAGISVRCEVSHWSWSSDVDVNEKRSRYMCLPVGEHETSRPQIQRELSAVKLQWLMPCSNLLPASSSH